MPASRPGPPGVPSERVRALNRAPLGRGDYVLYWMIAARRTSWNFALERALHLAGELERPLVVFEPLRVDYPWASLRLHRFVLDGMRDTAAALAKAGVGYYPYVEPRPQAARGLLARLAQDACAVITDDAPFFFLPRMLARAADEVKVLFEAVDSNGLLPLSVARGAFARAYDFRRFLQRELAPHLRRFPAAETLARVTLAPPRPFAKDVTSRWPAAETEVLDERGAALARLPIDQEVRPCETRGGARAGKAALERFVEQRLAGYAGERNDAAQESTSELSPYLHFGHVGAHQVFARIAAAEGWKQERLGSSSAGRREGWWGMSAGAEAFLDQLVTWRELGFQASRHEPLHDRFDGLPAWACSTLAKHAGDRRVQVYDFDSFDRARTHDELWNAAQNQLRQSGRIHNYLRMLWGKKILHWSVSPREAFETAVRLNDRYALDGRDPNSYSGIGWVFGKYDRPWGPEREVFGVVRYMSSDNTRRKMDVGAYLRRWGQAGGLFPD